MIMMMMIMIRLLVGCLTRCSCCGGEGGEGGRGRRASRDGRRFVVYVTEIFPKSTRIPGIGSSHPSLDGKYDT